MSRLLFNGFDETGTPQTVYPDGIASAEAFGTPVFAGPITFDDIPSSEQFGAVAFNGPVYFASIPSSEQFGTPKIAVESVSRVQVFASGGDEVELNFPAVDDGIFRVYFGPLGTAAAPSCLSAISLPGRPLSPLPFTDGKARVIMPRLAVGGPYQFYLVRLTEIGDDDYLSSGLVYVVAADSRGRISSLSQVLPPVLRP